MSIRWIQHVRINGEPSTLEVLLGWKRIADKCYVRVGHGEETWFRPNSDIREEVLAQGLGLLKSHLGQTPVQDDGGLPFSWKAG